MSDLKQMRELRDSDVPLIGTVPTRQRCVGEARYLALIGCAEALEDFVILLSDEGNREWKAARHALDALERAP